MVEYPTSQSEGELWRGDEVLDGHVERGEAGGRELRSASGQMGTVERTHVSGSGV